MQKTVSGFGIAIIGLGSAFLATPAQAFTLADCGTAPAGATLTFAGNLCKLTFSTPGTYSFTTPASVAGLSVLLVGGGGGTSHSAPVGGSPVNIGYAGSGGKVTYADFSSASPNETFAITVGAGGASSLLGAPDDGQSSTISKGSILASALGGAKGTGAIYCLFQGNTFDYIGVGDGAGGNTTSRAGEECVPAPGVNPSLAAADSNGQQASTLFASFNQEFGAGGKLIAMPATLPSRAPGAGANVVVDISWPSGLEPVADAAGADGFAAAVWQPKATLAETGSGWDSSMLIGLGSIAAGAALVTTRRRWAK